MSTNSRVSRVQPTIRWLQAYGGENWPQQLVRMAHGLRAVPDCGRPLQVFLDPERGVASRPQRLSWMLRNASRLTPQDGRQWRALNRRVSDRTGVEAAIRALESNPLGRVSRRFILEGTTYADCLIECERAFIWIEGKRLDWLSPSTKWDVTRDQLARNLEAAWALADGGAKDFCVLVCHEGGLKHHEQLLIDGYRNQTWTGGLPHVDAATRAVFAERIGTVLWRQIEEEWPQIGLGAAEMDAFRGATK